MDEKKNNNNNVEDNKNVKKKNLMFLPRNFIGEGKIIIRHRNSNTLDTSLQGELNSNTSSNSTKEYTDKNKKSQNSGKVIKHVSFNPKVHIINIRKYKKETKKFSYQCDYSESEYEEDFKNETEKKCLICSIF